MKYIIMPLFIIVAFFQPLSALHRHYNASSTQCYMHLSKWQLNKSNLTRELAQLIPAIYIFCDYYNGEDIVNCPNPSIYKGYYDFSYNRYRNHLRRHLEYCQRNRECICFWPECSNKAAEISNAAYLLFQDLVKNTALSKLVDDYDEQLSFLSTDLTFLNLHGLTIAFIAKQLHFSHYYNVCKDIEKYARAKYEEDEASEIKDKLLDILENIYPKFFELYKECYQKHPSPEIYHEILFMKFLLNDISDFVEKEFFLENLNLNTQKPTRTPSFITSSLLLTGNEKNNSYNFFSESDLFLEQGTLFNSLLLYKEAIRVLTKAIEINPTDRDAYIERAMAYFEIDQLPSALVDYESAKKLTINPPFRPNSYNEFMATAYYVPKDKTEFSKGLVLGTVEGAKVSAMEIIPSIFNSCRGILNGLWAFSCSPIEVSQEMIISAYAIGEFVSSHSTEECLQCVVPELKELSQAWNTLNDYSKGEKIGYIIGKYGVDIFAPLGTLKGINKVRSLKRANTMSTLEQCVLSDSKKSKILEESLKRATVRESLLKDSIKNGKTLVKNPNASFHIMQKKHAWDRLIKLSGDTEKDFNKILEILETENIVSQECIKKIIPIADGLIRREHEKIISNQVVKAIFIEYTETNEVYLNNAWVVIR